MDFEIPAIIATIEEAMQDPSFEQQQNAEITANFTRYCKAYNVPSITFFPKMLDQPKANPKAHLTKETIKELLFSNSLATKVAFEMIKDKVKDLETLALEIIKEQAPDGFVFSETRREFAQPSGAGFVKISPSRLFNIALLLKKIKEE